jgi:hypothetical protein
MQGGAFNFDVKLLQPAPPDRKNFREVRYWYEADEASVKLTQYGEAKGWAEVALTDKDYLAIQGTTPVRFELRGRKPPLGGGEGVGASVCDGVFKLLDGSGYEADFGRFGKLFFKPLEGTVNVTADFKDGVCTKFVAELVPDDISGHFNVAVHEYDAGTDLAFNGKYEDIEALKSANRKDYAAFRKNYKPVHPDSAETAEYAMWLIWTFRVKPGGYYKTPMILMHSQWLTACAAWQQSYNAMPMLGDPKEAWRQICSLFEHQDERTGQLPGMLFYTGGAAMQPPFQGFALDYIIKKCGNGFLTKADGVKMWPKFAAWANYWTTYRSAGRGDDVTAVRTPHDSGWDDASIFKDGFPATNPDIIAFLILLMECTALLAKKAGDEKASAEWQKRSEKLLKTLIDEFWDGEKFVTKKDAKTPVDSLSLACYQPILLGKRLPKKIIDAIAKKLTTEEELLSPIGLMTESLKSPILGLAHNFVTGRVVAPANMILTVGLHMAGKEKEASLIARRFCDKIKEEGMILGFSPVDKYPDNHSVKPGEWIDFDLPPIASDPWPWSGWSACSFLTMAEEVVK